jgi:hypothetical protein
MGDSVPIDHDRSFGIDGNDGRVEDVLGCDHKALDLAVGSDCLHLSADVEQIVLDVLEHIDL